CSRGADVRGDLCEARSCRSRRMDSQIGKGLQRTAASSMPSTFEFTPQKEFDDFPWHSRRIPYRKSRINRLDKTAGESHCPQQIARFLVRADFRRWARRE